MRVRSSFRLSFFIYLIAAGRLNVYLHATEPFQADSPTIRRPHRETLFRGTSPNKLENRAAPRTRVLCGETLGATAIKIIHTPPSLPCSEKPGRQDTAGNHLQNVREFQKTPRAADYTARLLPGERKGDASLQGWEHLLVVPRNSGCIPNALN